MTTQSKLLTNAEAAALIGIQPNSLEIWRSKGKGPKFIKLDPHSLRSAVRYRQSDIEEWIDTCTCLSTSQYRLQRLTTA